MIPKCVPALLCVGLLGSMSYASSAASPVVPAQHLGPSVSFIVVQGYQLAVSGSNWVPYSRVVFSLDQAILAVGLELMASDKGDFLVGINNVDACAGEVADARDFSHQAAAAPGPALACPVKANEPTPSLSILSGDQANIATTHVDLFHGTLSAKIVRGDSVYLWEQGTGTPMWVPQVASAYLQPIARGTTANRACPAIECSAGFFWQFAGMRQGKTTINVKCRSGDHVCPQIVLTMPVQILSWPVPILQFQPTSGYRMSIAGSDWSANQPVTIAVDQTPTVTGLELRTTSAGTFSVGVKNIDLCTHAVVGARDLLGDAVTLPGPALECTSRFPVPVPVLTILSGAALKVAQTHVDGWGPSGSITIRLGDAIYVWEAGKNRPLAEPEIDPSFFQLNAEGTTDLRACSGAECSAGFYWEYIGVRAGRTTLTLNPSCRKSTPPCEIPSRAIAVRIT
jgi:hypothetical protein